MLWEAFDAYRLERQYRVLEIGGDVIQVDTTDFDDIDCEGLFQAIDRATGNANFLCGD